MRGGRASANHGRDSVFKYQMLLIVRFEYQGILVEALNPAIQAHPAEKVDGNQCLFLAGIIQKTVLDILRGFLHN